MRGSRATNDQACRSSARATASLGCPPASSQWRGDTATSSNRRSGLGSRQPSQDCDRMEIARQGLQDAFPSREFPSRHQRTGPAANERHRPPAKAQMDRSTASLTYTGPIAPELRRHLVDRSACPGAALRTTIRVRSTGSGVPTGSEAKSAPARSSAATLHWRELRFRVIRIGMRRRQLPDLAKDRHDLCDRGILPLACPRRTPRRSPRA